MVMRISSEVIDAIVADARASPDEICGLLLGTPNRVMARVPCRNVAANPRRAFEIDPAELIARHRAARSGGPAIIGCYHSHPTGHAIPSPRDAAQAAADGQLWLIVAGHDVTLWRAVAQGDREDRFDSIDLVIE